MSSLSWPPLESLSMWAVWWCSYASDPVPCSTICSRLDFWSIKGICIIDEVSWRPLNINESFFVLDFGHLGFSGSERLCSSVRSTGFVVLLCPNGLSRDSSLPPSHCSNLHDDLRVFDHCYEFWAICSDWSYLSIEGVFVHYGWKLQVRTSKIKGEDNVAVFGQAEYLSNRPQFCLIPKDRRFSSDCSCQDLLLLDLNNAKNNLKKVLKCLGYDEGYAD